MMSSKRIAEKTGKEHSNVLRDIRNMIGELSESQDSNLNPDEYEEVKARNGMTAEILLNERLSLCLASGYSISLRMMIIDDWALMKRNLNKTKEFTTKELLLLQLETIERAEKAEKTVAILTHVNKTYTSTEIAKELGFKSANEMNKKLHDLGIQYKQNDTWILYSKYSGLAYVDIKQEVLDSGKVVYHRRWTQIGREFLINFLVKSLI